MEELPSDHYRSQETREFRQELIGKELLKIIPSTYFVSDISSNTLDG